MKNKIEKMLTGPEVFNYRKKMFEYAEKYLKIIDREVAEDLIANIYVKVCEGKVPYIDGDRQLTYLYVMLKNDYLNYLKQEQRVQYCAEYNEWEYIWDSDKNVCDQLDRECVLDAINQLEECYRCSLQMQLQGYQYNEIANILCIPEGTARRRVHTAKRILAKKLSDNYTKIA